MFDETTGTWKKLTIREQLDKIDRLSDSGFGPNPVAIVECPHCPAKLLAIDAKAHVIQYTK